MSTTQYTFQYIDIPPILLIMSVPCLLIYFMISYVIDCINKKSTNKDIDRNTYKDTDKNTYDIDRNESTYKDIDKIQYKDSIKIYSETNILKEYEFIHTKMEVINSNAIIYDNVKLNEDIEISIFCIPSKISYRKLLVIPSRRYCVFLSDELRPIYIIYLNNIDIRSSAMQTNISINRDWIDNDKDAKEIYDYVKFQYYKSFDNYLVEYLPRCVVDLTMEYSN